MYELIIQGEYGNNRLTFGMGSPFQIIVIDGLAPMTATINMMQLAGHQGMKFENYRVNPRTINLAFAIDYDAESSRLDAYKVLRLGSRLIITYRSELRDVTIIGYVQSVNVSHFAKKQRVTAVIVCPYPNWKGHIKSAQIGQTTEALLHFPLSFPQGSPIPLGSMSGGAYTSIENDGDVQIPIEEIALHITGTVSTITLEDYYGKTFTITGTYQAGDTIEIMNNGEYKYLLLYRNGVETNIFNRIGLDSEWLELPLYGNAYKITVGVGSVSSVTGSIYYRNEYEGV